MRKITIATLCALGLLTGLQAQTKQAVNATKMDRGMFIVQQSNIQTPPLQTQAISGLYTQGFESTTFPPTGWQRNSVQGANQWVRSTTEAHSGVASAFISYQSTTGLDWLILPHYSVTAATDSLVFWMKLDFQGYQPDSLSIKISTTDSALTSFTTTLRKLQEGVNYPPDDDNWYRYAASLQNYVGQQVYLAFKHYNVDGDGLFIDDVRLGTVPAAEVAPSSIGVPTSNAITSITPQATFVNNGSAAQTFNATMTITGGYSDVQTITGLAPSGTSTATFAAWMPAGAGTYTVTVISQLGGDANLLNDTMTKVVNVYNTFGHFGWDNMPALPGGRWATSPVFVKPCLSNTDTGFVYLISGYDAAFSNTTVNTRYNTVTGTYTTLAPIPQSRGQITPVHVRGKIYVIGGYSGSFSPVTTNSIYDIATNTWTTGATIPQAVGDYAIGVYADTLIYVVGGYTGSADVNLVQIYNTTTNTWTAGTPKPGTAVAGGRLGISGNNIVFVGGYSQALAATQSAAYLGVINPAAPATITWNTLPAYPAGPSGRLAGGVAFENNGLVYFAGGDPTGQGTLVLNSVYAYNTTLGAWEIGPNMLTSVSNISALAGAVHNDSLHLITMGGYNGVSVTTTHQWLNIGPAAPLPTGPADASICFGDSITLTAANALTYSWSPATALSSATIANPVSTTTMTMTYSLTMTKAYGCPVNEQVTVTVNPLPNVSASANDSTVCTGDMVTLTGAGATGYSWTGGVTDNVPFAATSTSTYTVTGTDANGCIDTASLMITVNTLPSVTLSGGSSICAGDSTLLTGSSGGTSQWYLNGAAISGANSNTYYATIPGVYNMTKTNLSGCSDSASAGITVVVNAIPTVNANATATTVCAGTSVTLSGTGADTYAWTGGVTDNVAFTPTVTDTFTVTGTDLNGCMDTATVMITVNALPAVSANATATTVCAGTPVTLSGSGTATSYSWTGGVTDNVAFTPAVTDTYTVTGTDANNCSDTATVMITVNALPAVVANATSTEVCAGASVTLTGSGATTYAWTGGVSDNVAFTPAVTDTYTVTGTDANNCSDTATIMITVNPLPTVTFTSSTDTICFDDAAITLSNASPAGGTFSGSGVSGTTFTPATAGNGSHTITYLYTDANGCEDNATDIIVVDPCTGIENAAAANSLSVYPNPAVNQLSITGSFSASTRMQLSLVNMLGENVLLIGSNVSGSYSQTIDISALPAGVYFLQVKDGDMLLVTKKVVKQ